jgi:hypothetical protein
VESERGQVSWIRKGHAAGLGKKARSAYPCLAPTVSAIFAPRAPNGLGWPVVVSRGGLTFHFSVQLRSDQSGDRGNPHPGHETDDRPQRTVSRVEIAEVG